MSKYDDEQKVADQFSRGFPFLNMLNEHLNMDSLDTLCG